MYSYIGLSEKNSMLEKLYDLKALKILNKNKLKSDFFDCDSINNNEREAIIKKLYDLKALKIVESLINNGNGGSKCFMYDYIGDNEKNKMLEKLYDLKSLKMLENINIHFKKTENEIQDDDLDALNEKLDVIRAFKLLQDYKYNFKKIDLNYDFYDDILSAKEDIYSEIINILFPDDYHTWNDASNERGKIKGYELYTDPDEAIIQELELKSPEIIEFIKFSKNIEKEKEFNILIDDLNIDTGADYSYIGAFVSLDKAGIILLIGDMYLFNSDSIKTLLDIKSYCKKENKRRKEVKFNEKTAA